MNRDQFGSASAHHPGNDKVCDIRRRSLRQHQRANDAVDAQGTVFAFGSQNLKVLQEELFYERGCNTRLLVPGHVATPFPLVGRNIRSRGKYISRGRNYSMKKQDHKVKIELGDVFDEALYFDKKDLSKALKCSERHIDNLKNRGEIPAPIKLGRLTRWSKAAFLQWIEAGAPSISA